MDSDSLLSLIFCCLSLSFLLSLLCFFLHLLPPALSGSSFISLLLPFHSSLAFLLPSFSPSLILPLPAYISSDPFPLPSRNKPIIPHRLLSLLSHHSPPPPHLLSPTLSLTPCSLILPSPHLSLLPHSPPLHAMLELMELHSWTLACTGSREFNCLLYTNWA